MYLQMVGQLNYDVWRGIIGFVVDDMRIKRDFPNKPDVSTSVASGAYEVWARSIVLSIFPLLYAVQTSFRALQADHKLLVAHIYVQT